MHTTQGRIGIGLIGVLLLAITVALSAGVWFTRAKRAGEPERFLARAEMVKVEMTKDQVDGNFRDYYGLELNDNRPIGGEDNLVRPSVVTKTYALFLHTGTTLDDGDCFIDVFFDKYGLVVGTHCWQLDR
jgi:hypothetical protein